MIILGICVFVIAASLLLAMAVECLRQQQVSSIVFAALSGYAWVSVFNAYSLAEQFSDEEYLVSALVYFVGSMTLSLSTWLFARQAGARRLPMPEWGQSDFIRYSRFALLLGVSSLILLVLSREDVLMNWSEARSEAGPTSVLAAFFLLLACPGIIAAWLAKRAVVTIALFVLCATSFVLLGSRAALLSALAFAVWLMLLRARGTASKVRVIAFAAIVGIAAHVLLRQVRGLGLGGLLQAIDDGTLLTTLFSGDANADLSGGELAISKYFLFSTRVSSVDDFGFMSSIQRVLLLPIPRIEGWIDKPVDVTYLLWEKAYEAGLFADADGQAILLDSYLSGTLGSLHPTLFGEYFLAGSWASLVLSTTFLGGTFSLIDVAMRRMDRLTSLALCGPLLVGYLFVARGNSVIGLGYFFYLGIIFTIVKVLASRVATFKCLGVFTQSFRRRVPPTRSVMVR